MKLQLFKNARIFTEEGYVSGDLLIEGDKIKKIITSEADTEKILASEKEIEVTDLQGNKIIPGLIDIHIHGAVGADFSDGDPEGLQKMSEYLASQGVTSFVPASMTLPYEKLKKAFQTAAEVRKRQDLNGDNGDNGANGDQGARILGINMEGPFLSKEKKGAQNEEYLELPDYDRFLELYELSEGMIKLVDIAPELPGAYEFAEKASGLCRVSAAHTNTDYETARGFFETGGRHLTHLFNGMPSLLHRSPGVIGAAAEREDVTAELICDGVHIHPSAVRLAFKMFPGRICLISDALMGLGMPEGLFELGGQKVTVKDGAAFLKDGTLAGSVSSVYLDMQNAIRFGIPEEEALKAATINPARAIHEDRDLGSLKEGKLADFVICDDKLNRKAVYIRGRKIG